MGTAPTPVLVSTYGTGNSLDGQITRDAIDDLVGAMSSHLLLYLSAAKITPGTTAFVERLGNKMTNATSHATKTTNDTHFNNRPSITLSVSDSNPFSTAAGGFGIGTPPIAMPNSFSIVAGLRVASTSNNGGIYGDGTNGNGGVSIGMGGSGNLVVNIGGATDVNAAAFFAANTTYAFWYSYDSATKIHRYGVNSTSGGAQVTGAGTRTSQGTSTVCYPFSEYSSAVSQFIFERWTLWNKAFMNGSVPADDTAFSNLVSAYAAYI